MRGGGIIKILQERLPEVFGLTANKLLQANENTSLKEEKIKTLAVISSPGMDVCLQISFEDGEARRFPLDGPALFNLNNEVAAALQEHLNKPYGGRG